MKHTATHQNIVICPLDWGLGHATRCIPLINELQSQGKQVIIASSGDALVLLKKEFPELHSEELPAYHIHYRHSSMAINMLKQFPNILATIKKEKEALEDIVNKHRIDLIISDNRYGCYHPNIKSVFITHQLNIQSPKWIKPIIDLTSRKLLNKFNEIWIPDTETNSFSGTLSQNKQGYKNCHYIGPLSRFSSFTPKTHTLKTTDILFILSGPEPQRSRWEHMILEQISGYPQKKFTLVRGLPKGDAIKPPKNCTTINYANPKKLYELIEQSQLIVTRSGYSTIMDLSFTNAKACFVPTPGQTEQEYLAHYHQQQGNCIYIKQSDFTINAALLQTKDLPIFNIKA